MNIDLIQQNMNAAKTNRVKQSVDPQRDKDLKEACRGFEAIFLRQMMDAMDKTLPGNALFPDSNASKIYKSMQNNHLAEQISQTDNSFGLKDFLYNQLKNDI